ncbi:hypothetical protein J4H86_26550 [Spiractinospora alimapuensis]|uniref:hypothetical protein n=1 Tax=Spiractinospora alimapuensis TaxID=2820884 RepID=UPI001F38D922|nr:hypothetical protein [Spiractinospora alimapuensis]QVQ52210.1 hypothetical protein J4H86_26550 [Spiractinospora alimapuensis]
MDDDPVVLPRPRGSLADCVRRGHAYRHLELGNPQSFRRCDRCGALSQANPCACDECAESDRTG